MWCLFRRHLWYWIVTKSKMLKCFLFEPFQLWFRVRKLGTRRQMSLLRLETGFSDCYEFAKFQLERTTKRREEKPWDGFRGYLGWLPPVSPPYHLSFSSHVPCSVSESNISVCSLFLRQITFIITMSFLCIIYPGFCYTMPQLFDRVSMILD